jgi:hypothetical protein
MCIRNSCRAFYFSELGRLKDNEFLPGSFYDFSAERVRVGGSHHLCSGKNGFSLAQAISMHPSALQPEG